MGSAGELPQISVERATVDRRDGMVLRVGMTRLGDPGTQVSAELGKVRVVGAVLGDLAQHAHEAAEVIRRC